MASLSSYLPAPTQLTWDRDIEEQKERANRNTAIVAATKAIPPYGNRSSWVPRNVSDFGDGGSFPEIHMAQYPLDMGRKDQAGQKSNALAIQLDAEGKIKYDAIARQGHGKDKVVFSKFTDLLPAEITNEDDPTLHKPSDEEIADITEKTRRALEQITHAKVEAALPVRAAERTGPAQFIRYTPAQQGDEFNSGAKQRIIRMVEVQKDPMEPPRFKINQKIPRGPPSPPAPVLHSPTRKVTVKEQQEWKIPPCISNWKNAKGYTIPLDKRLAADGRGLQQVHINEKFAKLAESLYIADRKARESVELRAQLQKKQAQKEKEKKEDTLRQLAQQVREERAGLRPGGGGAAAREDDDDAAERDNLRQERHRERQRERNIARAAPGDKKSKLDRQRERDISEQIALGMPARASASGETMYDQRLLNQTRGMDSGFADDEAYNVYDKPWREQGTLSQNLYRPTKNLDQDLYGDDLDKLVKTSKFVPDKEFSGTDRSGPSGSRSGPVQFEKEEDPFGLDKFLTDVRKASSKRPTDADRSEKDKDKRRRRD
ncbi:puff-specific protein Bx42-like [Daphnia carinata]|uniref:puff-specific protein Bx42-like n=1 Tax=Daphnia carinata TaxID=120202 RepID=UPI00257AF62F|nr:puff-specific protein Bx42-like [Daphnia carinata]